MNSASVLSPCSSANLGSGFDAVAIALDAFHDEIIISRSTHFSVVGDGVPTDPEKNTAGLTALRMIRELGLPEEFSITIRKGVPKGLGLGSSGASASAAAVAINEFFRLGLRSDDLIRYAMMGEAASSGTAHPDNVAASIMGGLTIVSRDNGIRASRIEVPDFLYFLIAIPDIKTEGKTRIARQMIPDKVPFSSYYSGISRVASFIAGMVKGDRDLIRSGMNDDVVEPARLPLFPYYYAVKEKALADGAVGVAVSGAGPSLIIACDESSDAKQIARDVQVIFASYGINGNVLKTRSSDGAYVQGTPLSD